MSSTNPWKRMLGSWEPYSSSSAGGFLPMMSMLSSGFFSLSKGQISNSIQRTASWLGYQSSPPMNNSLGSGLAFLSGRVDAMSMPFGMTVTASSESISSRRSRSSSEQTI